MHGAIWFIIAIIGFLFIVGMAQLLKSYTKPEPGLKSVPPRTKPTSTGNKTTVVVVPTNSKGSSYNPPIVYTSRS